VKIYADGQRKIISEVDEKAIQLYSNNPELEQLWKNTITRDITQIEKECLEKSNFFSGSKHTMHISNMDIIHGTLIKNIYNKNTQIHNSYIMPITIKTMKIIQDIGQITAIRTLTTN